MAQKPTLRQLKYLCTVADEHHFGNAAKACHVTQSTLSAGIQELEAALGIALIERSHKSVLLTPIGTMVVRRSRQILIEVEALIEEAAAALAPFNRPIRLGVIPTIAPFLLPTALAALRRDHPEFQLLIREDLSEKLVNLLHQGELDLLLMALPYPMTNVTTHHLFDDPFVLAYPARHPLGKVHQLRTRDLKGHDILLLEQGHCLRDQALEACKLQSTQISLAFEATSLHTLVPMVANGIGVTLLPRMAIDSGIISGLQNIDIRAFDGREVSRSIDLVWRKQSPRSQEYQMLVDYLMAAKNRRS
jgi:LysR family hydrogen peroxide-inducible transcriptional activator